MQKTFNRQIGRNLEVYVDDIIIKSFEVDDHVRDLVETFANLNWNNIKLNPEKCVFGIQSGKVLGYMVDAPALVPTPRKLKPSTVRVLPLLLGTSKVPRGTWQH